MTIQQIIIDKLQQFTPIHLEVINESHMHNVPVGSESHFKVIIVSDDFTGKMLVARHRMINQRLQHELKESIHALSLHTMTEPEWLKKQGKVATSPPCLGGGANKG